MKITWEVTKSDIHKINRVLAENDNPFLQARRLKNVEKQNIVIDKNSIIKTMFMCLLTSQQRSGPNSIVGRFLRLDPFPVMSETIKNIRDIEKFVKSILQNFGLTRYINRNSKYFASNYQRIKDNNWEIINILNQLIDNNSKTKEREIADSIKKMFDGFGPKQSRNFLQSLGLNKYEIPIDSRITNWLNDFGFPVSLSSSSLSDIEYYNFVSDGIQELCQKAGIYPCILDAAIFSSYDNGGWTEDNIIF